MTEPATEPDPVAREGRLRQAGFQGGGRVVALLLNLITIGITIAELSPAEFGALTLSNVIAYACALMAAFGTDTVLLRALSLDQHDRSTLGSVVLMRVASGLVMAGALSTAAFLLPLPQDLRTCLLAAAPVLLTGPAVAMHQVLRSRVELVPFAFADIGSSGLLLVSILAFSADGLAAWEAVFSATASNALVWFILAGIALRRLRPGRPKASLPQVRPVIRQARAVFGGEFLTLGYYRADVLLLGVLAPAPVLGAYGAVYRFVDVAMYIPSIVIGALFPGLAKGWRDGRIQNELRVASHLLLSTGVIAAVAGTPLVVWLVGRLSNDTYPGVSEIAAVLMCSLPLLFLSRLGLQALLAGGFGRWQLMCVSAGFTGTASAIVLVPAFGGAGAALATAVGELAILVACSLVLRRRGLGLLNVEPVSWVLALGGMVVAATMYWAAVPIGWSIAAGGAVLGAALLGIGVIRHERDGTADVREGRSPSVPSGCPETIGGGGA